MSYSYNFVSKWPRKVYKEVNFDGGWVNRFQNVALLVTKVTVLPSHLCPRKTVSIWRLLKLSFTSDRLIISILLKKNILSRMLFFVRKTTMIINQEKCLHAAVRLWFCLDFGQVVNSMQFYQNLFLLVCQFLLLFVTSYLICNRLA